MYFVVVVTKLEFRARPPLVVNATVSETVVIDCTASVAPGFPLVITEWTKHPLPLCEGKTVQLDVSPNGTLVISQTKMEDEGLYTCKAFTRDETITTTVRLNVSPSRVYRVE